MDKPRSSSLPSRIPLAMLALAAIAILLSWWGLGLAISMPSSPLADSEKLYCVSYAPFRGQQTPLDLSTRIEPWQIEDDLDRLSHLTDCVRTYSVELGLDRTPEIARRHGMKVILGLWLSSNAGKNRREMETAIALANEFRDVVRAVVVGNEVLLRGEIAAADLSALIRQVKAKVPVPVTYADVWEFWLRHREIYSAVDFVTIHILPYWEDFPIPARNAAGHVDAIRKIIATAFPDKEILIGETGWPSEGRMREGALPSRANQAWVLQEVLALAKHRGFRVNLIEAFDQPWKRVLEGTVGGHWGLFDGAERTPKFRWGEAVSNHPSWMWWAIGGTVLAAVIFAATGLAGQRGTASPGAMTMMWLGVGINAAVAGVFVGLTIEKLPIVSFDLGGWLRSLAFASLSIASPLIGSVALTRGISIPSFTRVLAHRTQREKDKVALALGVLLIAVTLLALQAALGLGFDPRYRDFPLEPLTAAIVPLVTLLILNRPTGTRRGASETAAAAVLGLSAIYILLNEGLANWQAIWFVSLLIVLALTLSRVADARS